MSANPVAQKMAQMVGAYFEACRKLDANAIAACFAPGGVHYFPHRAPLLEGAGIGAAIVEDLRNRGGQYFVDKIFSDVEQCAAAVERCRRMARAQPGARGQ
jgi:hypothetical protein